MTSHLKQVLDQHPELKKEFDQTVAVHPGVRMWFGALLKKIMKAKDEFDDIAVTSLKWTLIKLRKRNFELSESEKKDMSPAKQIQRKQQYLFAHGNAIYVEEYRKYFLLDVKKEKERRKDFSTMKEIFKGMM